MKYLKIFSNLGFAVLIMLGVVFVLPRLLVFFMPFVIGYLISVPANSIVRLLERHTPVKRSYVSSFYIILVLALVFLLLGEVVTQLYYELQDIAGQLPTIAANIRSGISEAILWLQNRINRIPFVKDVNISSLAENLSQTLLSSSKITDWNWMSGTVNTVRKIPDLIIYTIIAIISAYFFIADKEKVAEFYRKHVPESTRSILSNLYAQSIGVVGNYFKAQLKIMIVIYVILLTGLLIMRVNYAWLIALGIAFLDMLPVLGTGTVLIPWALIKAFSGDYTMCAGLLILAAVSFIAHQTIQPKMISNSVGLDPFAALFLMYLGYRLDGTLGMLISIPIGMVIIQMARTGAFDNQIWCVRELVNDFNRLKNVEKMRKEGGGG